MKQDARSFSAWPEARDLSRLCLELDNLVAGEPSMPLAEQGHARSLSALVTISPRQSCTGQSAGKAGQRPWALY